MAEFHLVFVFSCRRWMTVRSTRRTLMNAIKNLVKYSDS